MNGKRDKHGNLCRKIKPSDPKGRFVYPSAEYADTHITDHYGDVRRYLRDVKEHFGEDIEGMKKELQHFIDIYARQHKWFTNSIVKQDLKERRRQWCKGAIEEAIRFRSVACMKRNIRTWY